MAWGTINPNAVGYLTGGQEDYVHKFWFWSKGKNQGSAQSVSAGFAEKLVTDGLVLEWNIDKDTLTAFPSLQSAITSATAHYNQPPVIPEQYLIQGQVKGSFVPLSINDAPALHEKINYVLERYLGWTCNEVSIENNGFFSIALTKTGSVSLAIIGLVIWGIMAVMFAIYRITYSITKVSDNKVVEEQIDNQQKIIDGLTQLKNDGVISEATFEQLLSQLIATPPPIPDGNGNGWTDKLGDIVPMAVLLVLAALVVTKK